MKKLNATDLKNLKYGEKVVRFLHGKTRSLRFVAIMPSCSNYLIFEDVEYLTHLHIYSNTGDFIGEWYGGEYNSKFIGGLKIEYLERQIENTKSIYIDQQD
jgi:hypothetical protein